jgi:hypothetical protein
MDGQSIKKKARVSLDLSVPKLYTLKVTFDPAWTTDDYVNYTNQLFPGSEKVLVVAEKLCTKAHVHFHGYSPYTEETMIQKVADVLTANHYTRKPGPGYRPSSRPASGTKMVATEEGFRYLCKEPPTERGPLYQRGFTEEELIDLHEKSQEYVKNLKETLRDWVRDLPFKPEAFNNPAHLYAQAILRADVMYLKPRGKDPSRFTRLDVAKGLRLHKHCTNEFLLWLYENNKF